MEGATRRRRRRQGRRGGACHLLLRKGPVWDDMGGGLVLVFGHGRSFKGVERGWEDTTLGWIGL